MVPNGMKLLGEWSHVGSGRVFRLIDVEDAAALPEATMPWTDIGSLDVYPGHGGGEDPAAPERQARGGCFMNAATRLTQVLLRCGSDCLRLDDQR